MKKIGTQIILIAMAAMTVTALLILVPTLMMFRSYNNGLLTDKAVVGMQVLENSMQNELNSLNSDYWMWAEDREFEQAVIDRNADYFKEHFASEYAESGGEFCLIADGDGNVIYNTDNYIINLDIGAIARGTVYNGVIQEGDHLALVFGSLYSKQLCF